MYALLAATSSRMRRVSGVSFRPGNSPEIYLHKALQCLRMLLDDQSAAEDRQIILDIYYLSVCGWYMESYGESMTHFNVLKHFWKTLTPRESTLDQYIYEMLNYNAIFLDCDAAYTPESVLPGLLHPSTASGSSYHSSTLQPERHYSYSQCSAFRLALEHTTYSPDLKKVVQELPILLRLYNYLHQKPDFIGPETDWVRSKSKALVLRLLELPSYGGELYCRLALVLLLHHISQSTATKSSTMSDSTCSSPEPDNPKPKPKHKSTSIDPVAITLRLKRQLQYEIHLPSNEISAAVTSIIKNGTASVPAPAPSPTSSTQQSPPSPPTKAQVIWTGKSDPFLLWILTTGLFSARITQQTPEYQWFWARAMALIRILGVKSMKQLEELVRSFVWVEGMLDDDGLEDILPSGGA
ncbi:uncharacterized protein A1O5_12182 [Cladophialophora psammophila CBS 110553]|uniref:Uncharacterized protein n=1 Tax=Cladophialophora psammophila CBS 110553 TaxID=1182543 RepID=W9W434_9EURO|nr:uncharacterized protein A1O5_12182 [Cladophialophora psammophila CBS 110553]EXJ59301.1 hypothetical protein A1O5_12182 [Cladophialophora psammophila CBS 110553]